MPIHPANSGSVRLLHVTTIPLTLIFLRGQAAFFRARGYEVEVISSPGRELDEFARAEGVPAFAVPMARRITPLRDLVALGRLWVRLRRRRPRIVDAHTPKAGLLGMIAARLAGIRVRVYHLRGLPLATASGWRRRLLLAAERTACRLAQRVIAVSGSLRDAALAERLCPPEKIVVLAGGSGQGVDAAGRFNPERLPPAARGEARRRWGLPAEARVLGFLGRLVRDKGIVELAVAWDDLAKRYPDLHLLLVGPEEPRDPVPPEVLAALQRHPRVRFAGLVEDTPLAYATCDLVTLPTYREGFPNVPLEAAAMGLPVVATRVPGCVDAVIDGETGLLVPPRDAEALARAISRYLDDPELARRHGQAGRARVLADFRREGIWEALAATYEDLLARSGAAAPGAAG